MAQFSSTVDVAASPAEAFAFLADPAKRGEWDPSVRSVAPIGAASGRVGDRYDVTVGFYGRAIEAVYEIAESCGPTGDEPGRIVFSTDGKVTGRDVIEITPIDGGARITLDLTVKLKGAARLLDRGLQLAFAGIGENATAGVVRKLSAGASEGRL
jgi:carbon monoxide dehydrogenase subunit G